MIAIAIDQGVGEGLGGIRRNAIDRRRVAPRAGGEVERELAASGCRDAGELIAGDIGSGAAWSMASVPFQT